MNRKTRLFLWIGGAVLVVGIGTSLLMSYLGLSAIALGSADGPADLKYVPADARVVAYADIDDLVHSEFHRVLLERRPASAADRPSTIGRLKGATGIDPERDLQSVLIFVPSVPLQADRHETALLARGRFTPSGIESAMREHGAEVTEYKGKRFVRNAGEQGDFAMAFLESDLMAFGSTAAVRQSIDLAAGGQNVTGNERMMDMIGRASSGNVWAAGRFDTIARRDRLPKEMAIRLQDIGWFAAGARVNGGLEGSLYVEARDEAAAKDLRDVIQGFVALGRLQSGKGTAITTMLDSIQLGGDGRTVSVAFEVPSAAMTALTSDLPPHRPPQ